MPVNERSQFLFHGEGNSKLSSLGIEKYILKKKKKIPPYSYKNLITEDIWSVPHTHKENTKQEVLNILTG